MSNRMSLDLARRKLAVWEKHESWELEEIDRILMDSWRTIVACGDTLARLDREYTNVHNSNPPPRDDYTEGYLKGINQAHQWLHDVLNPSSAN